MRAQARPTLRGEVENDREGEASRYLTSHFHVKLDIILFLFGAGGVQAQLQANQAPKTGPPTPRLPGVGHFLGEVERENDNMGNRTRSE